MSTTLSFRAQCARCRKATTGRLYFDQWLKVSDSDGGILFADGWTCHNCLGQPWCSADVTFGRAKETKGRDHD